MIGGVDVAMSRRDERDDADAVCMYFFQFWPNMVVQLWPTKRRLQEPITFRYDERNEPLPDTDLSIFKDQETYDSYIGAPAYTENMIEVKIDFHAVSLVLGEKWDISSVVAYFYRHGEQPAVLA